MKLNRWKFIKSIFIVIFIALLVTVTFYNKNRTFVGVYSINMMYACGECTTYKVFEIESGQLLYLNNEFDFNGKDKIFLLKYKMARMDDNNIETDWLVGKEFNLSFDSDKKRKEFENISGKIKYPACYIFYFKGEWGQEYKWFFEAHNTLNVKLYKIIPDKKCLYKNSNSKVDAYSNDDVNVD